MPSVALLEEARRCGGDGAAREGEGGGSSGASGAAIDAMRATPSASLLSSTQLHGSAVTSISVAPADAPPLFASVGADRAVIVYTYSSPSLSEKLSVVSGARAEGAAESVWRPRQSKKDGRTYYVNVLTRETAWTLPADAVVDVASSVNGRRAADASRAGGMAERAAAAGGGSSSPLPAHTAHGLAIDVNAPRSEGAASARAALRTASVRGASKVLSLALRSCASTVALHAPGRMTVAVQCALRGHGSAVHAVAWRQWRAGLVVTSGASGESTAWNLVSGALERRVPCDALRGEEMGFDGSDILAAGDAARGGARAAPERGAAHLHSQDVALAQQRERSVIAAPRERLCATAHGGAGRADAWRGGARYAAASYERALGKAHGGGRRGALRAASGRSSPR